MACDDVEEGSGWAMSLQGSAALSIDSSWLDLIRCITGPTSATAAAAAETAPSPEQQLRDPIDSSELAASQFLSLGLYCAIREEQGINFGLLLLLLPLSLC